MKGRSLATKTHLIQRQMALSISQFAHSFVGENFISDRSLGNEVGEIQPPFTPASA